MFSVRESRKRTVERGCVSRLYPVTPVQELERRAGQCCVQSSSCTADTALEKLRVESG